MKILGLTPRNEFTGETPEEAQLRELSNLGHDVCIMERCEELPVDDIDIIVAMSESTVENAFKLSKKYNIPYFAHMEWLPEWRIFKNSETNWGYINKIPYQMKMNFIRMYQRYVYFWSCATVKTLAANCFHKVMNEFTGMEALIGTKYVGIDVEKIKPFNKDVKKENSIVCIARFVPHKRIHHIIKALQMINYKGTLKLVGYGPEKINYEMIANGLFLEFIPSEKKFEALKSSKLCIALWSGIVPAEAFYMGIPVITYESDYMRELYDDTLVYVTNNSVQALAMSIKAMLYMPESGRTDMARYGVEKIENEELNVFKLDKSAKLLELLLLKAKVIKK